MNLKLPEFQVNYIYEISLLHINVLGYRLQGAALSEKTLSYLIW